MLGIRLGLNFPDLDLSLPFLRHRSFLTHGLLLPVLLFFALRWCFGWRPRLQLFLDIPLRLLLIGICVACTVHLCFDLFPRAWYGFALIWVPFYGRATPTFSWMWLGASCVVCLYLALLLVRHLLEIMLSALGLGLTFVLESSKESSFVLALGALLLVSTFALALPSKARGMVQEWAGQRS